MARLPITQFPFPILVGKLLDLSDMPRQKYKRHQDIFYYLKQCLMPNKRMLRSTVKAATLEQRASTPVLFHSTRIPKGGIVDGKDAQKITVSMGTQLTFRHLCAPFPEMLIVGITASTSIKACAMFSVLCGVRILTDSTQPCGAEHHPSSWCLVGEEAEAPGVRRLWPKHPVSEFTASPRSQSPLLTGGPVLFIKLGWGNMDITVAAPCSLSLTVSGGGSV